MHPKTVNNIYAAHHVNEIPPETRLIAYPNIAAALDAHVQAEGDKPFLIYYDRDGRDAVFSYAEFMAQVYRVANFLYQELGIRKGDRVATIAYNHSDTVIIYYACWVLGAAVVPQNMSEDDRHIAFILRNSDSSACFIHCDYLDRAEGILFGNASDGLGAPNIKNILTFGETQRGKYPYLNMLASRHPTIFSGDFLDSPQSVAIDTEALLVYTSGTTGAPKGVVLTQYNLLVDAFAIAEAHQITADQRMMCVLPLHHVNGIVVTLITPLFVGATTVLNQAFSASHFWQIVVDEKVNVVSVVPTLLQFLLEYGREQGAGDAPFGPGITRKDLAHFRHFICGAGTLALNLSRDFEDTFEMPIIHGYGLSETTCYSCFLPLDADLEEHRRWLYDHGYPSIGVPVKVNEMGIFAPDGSGRRFGPGERGEICIRGHNVMKYYYNHAIANRDAFWFGWFRSGDEGFYLEDAQGRPYFFITGRIKELINRGGVKFSPFDIEEVLLEIPGVKIGLAVAFGNDYYGEEVGAYIVLDSGVKLTEEQILAHCRKRLTFEKSPKVVVYGMDAPVTSTGKYKRLKLQDLFVKWKGVQFREE